MNQLDKHCKQKQGSYSTLLTIFFYFQHWSSIGLSRSDYFHTIFVFHRKRHTYKITKHKKLALRTCLWNLERTTFTRLELNWTSNQRSWCITIVDCKLLKLWQWHLLTLFLMRSNIHLRLTRRKKLFCKRCFDFMNTFQPIVIYCFLLCMTNTST